MEKKQDKKIKIEEKTKKIDKDEDLSEQDKALKDKIEFKVERICTEKESNPLKHILELFEMLITTKKSRTSIPKEIKFLKSHYSKLVEEYEKTSEESKKKNLANLLSFASISLAENYNRDSLKYLQQGTGDIKLETMGEEYILNMAGDLAEEYKSRFNEKTNPNFDDLLKLVDEVLPIMFKRGDDISAIDLLMDIEQIDKVHSYINKGNYSRLFHYLLCSLEYSSDNIEFNSILNNLYQMSMKNGDLINAMRVSIRQNNMERIKEVFRSSKNDLERKQLCFALARHRIILKEVEEEELVKIMSNSMLTEFYMKLVKDLDVLKPKKPREIYKEMIGEKEETLDSALLNLADSFVNAFVNVGTGKDTLLNIEDDKKEEKLWIQRVKDKGIMSTVASLGLIYLWNFEEFQVKLSDYLDLKDGYAKAGSCIALGLSASGVWDESDPAMAILMDAMESTEECMKLGAAIGLGLAYATSSREEFKEPLAELINDENLQIETSVSAALSLSLIFVSECDEDVINTILTSMMIFGKESLDKNFAKFFGVALAINFLGRQEQSETCIEALQSIEHPIAKYAAIAVETCAYIGSGNVLLIQKYMQKATKHYDEKTQQDEIEQVNLGLIGVALISVSEVVGIKMIIRNIHHIMQYCDLPIKRVVPIMLTIVGIQNLNIQVTDLLYKLAHDEDKEIALRALLGLGVIAAGTNNSRIGGLLRNLGLYYENENEYLYVIRISLGILYAGKGLVGINQYYSDGFLYNKTGFAGLFMFFHSMLNLEEFLIKNNHYMFYYFSLGFYPKMLFVLDENLENVKVNVRVGQAIDTVGQVGKPRKITGFQTHTSPVVIDNGERAELATEEYIPCGETILENLIIVKKNPDYVEEERK